MYCNSCGLHIFVFSFISFYFLTKRTNRQFDSDRLKSQSVSFSVAACFCYSGWERVLLGACSPIYISICSNKYENKYRTKILYFRIVSHRWRSQLLSDWFSSNVAPVVWHRKLSSWSSAGPGGWRPPGYWTGWSCWRWRHRRRAGRNDGGSAAARTDGAAHWEKQQEASETTKTTNINNMMN